jgi:hypothetical protein
LTPEVDQKEAGSDDVREHRDLATMKSAVQSSWAVATVAFVLTTPLNRWMIARGKGHAVVHSYHSH